nr:hypothetical protein [Tanacetum cinerariifolium]
DSSIALTAFADADHAGYQDTRRSTSGSVQFLGERLISWSSKRDDILFSTIKVVSRHQDTQQYGSTLPIELTTEDIRNTNAYQEYYVCATGEAAPKPKASARKKKSGSASSTTPLTHIATLTPTSTVVAAPRLSATAKDVDEQTKGRDASEGEKTDESDDDNDDQEEAEKGNDDDDDEEEISKIGEQETTESDEGDDEATKSDRESEDEETREQEEESFDPIPRTPKESEDDDNNEEDQGLRIGEEERMHEEEEAEELYRDVDINQERGLQVSQETEDSHVILTPTQSDAQQESSSTSSFMTNLLNPTMDPGMDSIFTTGSSTVTPIPLPQSTMTPSIISTFTTASQLPTPPTSIPTDLLEMELKKILIDKMEGNKSIQRSDEQRNLYKALVEAYDADKTILDTYGESAILKRRREDDDQEGPSAGSDQGSKRRIEGGEHASANTPSEPATEKEPVQTTCQMEEPSHPVFETKAKDQPIVQTSQHPEWFSQPSKPPTPNRDWNKSLPAAQGDAQSWISTLAKQTDARSSFNELLDTPIDFSNFIMNRLDVDTLTPELLAGPTYELMRGSCNSLIELEYHLEEVYKATTDQLDWPLPLIPDNRGRRVIPFEHFINNDLEYLRGGASSQKYTTSVTKTKAADYGHIKWIEELVPRAMWIQEPINYDKHAFWGVFHWGRKCQQFYGFAVNQESALDVYSKRRIIAVIDLKIVEWHNYKHLDWISLSNLTVEERFAFNVSLKMFMRSIVIQRRVEDLQMGVESYQKRLNLTKPDTYRSDLK